MCLKLGGEGEEGDEIKDWKMEWKGFWAIGAWTCRRVKGVHNTRVEWSNVVYRGLRAYETVGKLHRKICRVWSSLHTTACECNWASKTFLQLFLALPPLTWETKSMKEKSIYIYFYFLLNIHIYIYTVNRCVYNVKCCFRLYLNIVLKACTWTRALPKGNSCSRFPTSSH